MIPSEWMHPALQYLECAPNCKNRPQLEKITIKNIWQSTPILTFIALSKWHEHDIIDKCWFENILNNLFFILLTYENCWNIVDSWNQKFNKPCAGRFENIAPNQIQFVEDKKFFWFYWTFLIFFWTMQIRIFFNLK